MNAQKTFSFENFLLLSIQSYLILLIVMMLGELSNRFCKSKLKSTIDETKNTEVVAIAYQWPFIVMSFYSDRCWTHQHNMRRIESLVADVGVVVHLRLEEQRDDQDGGSQDTDRAGTKNIKFFLL